MSVILVVLVICLVIIYVFSESSKKRQLKQQQDTTFRFRKKDTYLKQCQILNAMVAQKAQSGGKSSRPKLSVHISIPSEINQVDSILSALKVFKVYLVINTEESQPFLVTQIGELIQPSRVFRCNTLEGQIAIIRQLNPDIHIETDQRIVKALKPHLKRIVTTSNLSPVDISSNVVQVQRVSSLLETANTLKI